MMMQKRIQEMEERFDKSLQAVAELSTALEHYVAVQADLAELQHYINSGAWRRDYEADEAGLLPSDLKRGVLSEDGLWNLLTVQDELLQQMRELCS